MSSIEPALRVLRTQLQFELAEIAANVVRATQVSAATEREVGVLTQRCKQATEQLRGALHRTIIDPALVAILRGLTTAEQRAQRDAQTRLVAAQQNEQQARDALTQVRKREQSFDRALREAARKKLRSQQVTESVRVDDLWLQHSWNISR